MKITTRYFTILLTACLLLAVSSCDFSSQLMSSTNSANEIKVKRFDRLEYQYLTTGEFSALQQMSTDYPTETRTLIEDILRIGQMNEEETNKRFLTFFQDSLLQSLIRDTEEKFANMDKLNDDLTDAFRRLNKALPKIATPYVYSQITALDQSIVIKDGSIGISLDKYLGKDYPIYKEFFKEEQLEKMTPKMIIPDCVLFYLISLYPLDNFDSATQEERDMHIGKMQYLANKIVGFRAYNDEPLKKMEAYLKKHKDITIESMFEEMEPEK
ncbi:MAG: gliding motility protein GldB [Bacteroidaceae bacterium]|nr:gliding motility protein GldB [Bacteroidaceae bacterium]